MGCFFNWPRTRMRLKWRNDPKMNGMIPGRRWWLDGMTECSRIGGVFRIKGFAFVRKTPFIWPHSVILHHSRMTKDDEMKSKWVEWHKNDISPLWFSFLVILKWHGMTEWGGMEGFSESEKNMISEMSLIPPSFRHPVIIQEFTNKLSNRLSMEWCKNDSEWQ